MNTRVWWSNHPETVFLVCPDNSHVNTCFILIHWNALIREGPPCGSCTRHGLAKVLQGPMDSGFWVSGRFSVGFSRVGVDGSLIWDFSPGQLGRNKTILKLQCWFWDVMSHPSANQPNLAWLKVEKSLIVDIRTVWGVDIKWYKNTAGNLIWRVSWPLRVLDNNPKRSPFRSPGLGNMSN